MFKLVPAFQGLTPTAGAHSRVTCFAHGSAICQRRRMRRPCQVTRMCSSPKPLPEGNSNASQGPDAGNMGFVGPDQLGIAFTCGVCNTRVTKAIKRKSYETGVVVIKCPGCLQLHVVADNLGQFRAVTEGKKNIEELAAAKGENFTRVQTSVFELEKLISNSGSDNPSGPESPSGE